MNEKKKTLEYWQTILEDKYWVQVMSMIHKGKDINQAVLESFGHLISDPIRLNHMDHNDFKRLVNGWLTNKRFPKTVFSKQMHDLK